MFWNKFDRRANEQVLPMVGNFIFVRPVLLPGFLMTRPEKNCLVGY
jgi:hypothetical protein